LCGFNRITRGFCRSSWLLTSGESFADTYERATSDKDHATAVRGFTQEFAKRIGVLEG
jgi:hypothetical protein